MFALVLVRPILIAIVMVALWLLVPYSPAESLIDHSKQDWFLPLVLTNAIMLTVGLRLPLFAPLWRQWTEYFSTCRAFLTTCQRWALSFLVLFGFFATFFIGMGVSVVVSNFFFGGGHTPNTAPTSPQLPLLLMLFLFPLTQALVEIPFYAQFLEGREVKKRPIQFALVVLIFAAQHLLLPLGYGFDFVLGRMITFLPLSLYVLWVFSAKPQYRLTLLAAHLVADMMVVVQVMMGG